MNKISMMEIMLLSVTVVISTAVLFMPYLTAQAAGADAWVSVLAAGAAAILPAWAAATVMSRFPKMSIIQALPIVFGGLLGKALALAFIAFFLFGGALIVWQLEEFVVGTLIPETPEIAIRILFLIGIAYATFSGATPLIRTNAYVMPVGVVVIALVIGLPIARMDPSFLLPVFEHGYRPMLNGAILLLGWLCQIPLVMMMFQRYVEPKFLHKAAKKAVIGILVAVLALELGALGTMAAFGPRQTASMYYPSFAVARIISVGAFLEHIEVIFVGIWIAAMFIAATFYIQAFADSVSDTLNIKGQAGKSWILGSTFLLLIIWPFFFELDVYLLVTVLRDLAPQVNIGLGGVLPLLLLARIIIAPLPPEKALQARQEIDKGEEINGDKDAQDNEEEGQQKEVEGQQKEEDNNQ